MTDDSDTRPTESARSLREELATISAAWTGIRAEFAESTPTGPFTLEEWEDLISLNYIAPRAPNAGLSFAEAWWSVTAEARQLFIERFVPWAVRVVNLFGVTKFPMDAPRPQFPLGSCDYEPGMAIYELTGTHDTAEAGLRLILWAAACKAPELCRRSSEYATLMFTWPGKLIAYSGASCRTFREIMEWASAALEHLEAQRRRLDLDVAKLTVRLGDDTWPLPDLWIAHYLDSVIRANGNWISTAQIEKERPLCEGKNFNRDLKKKLPQPVWAIIDTESGKGHRLKVEEIERI